MAGRLQDKVCIITGAGSGMGKAMARIFTREGARLVLADISGNQDAVAKEVGNGAIGVHCDVSNEDDVKAMVGAAESEFGRLDVLCNNAGFGGGMGALHTQSTELWDKVHGTNIRGVFFGIKYGVISMLKTGGGAI